MGIVLRREGKNFHRQGERRDGDVHRQSEGLHRPGMWGSSRGAGRTIRPERVVI